MRIRILCKILRLLHILQVLDILDDLKLKAMIGSLGKRSVPMIYMWFQFITNEPRFAGLVTASTVGVQVMGSYSDLEFDQAYVCMVSYYAS